MGKPAFRFLRRGVLTGLTTAPALTMPALTMAAEPRCIEEAAEQAAQQLKAAKGTKLVMLGSGGGPGPIGPERKRLRRMTADLIVSNGPLTFSIAGWGHQPIRSHRDRVQ
ncbi:MAG TPA: hypothetical protein VH684_07890 [Xanthobacteraceae bacterium]|jgi:hypothetical protein